MNPENNWRPGASRLAVEARARLLADIRHFACWPTSVTFFRTGK